MTMRSEEAQTQLSTEATLFRNWARDYIGAHGAHGEWECDYPEWNRVYEVFDEYLRAVDVARASTLVIGDLLYLLARDNECENIARKIAELQPPDRLLFLAEQSSALGEANARWQLAVQLGALSLSGAEHARIECILLAFMRDEDEYVRRRSLQALASQRSAAVESLALAAWNEIHDSQQWTRMNVLEVLRQVSSTRLPELLKEAASDPGPYLATFARNLLAGKPGWSPSQYFRTPGSANGLHAETPTVTNVGSLRLDGTRRGAWFWTERPSTSACRGYGRSQRARVVLFQRGIHRC